jgi:predicted amidohydrolase
VKRRAMRFGRVALGFMVCTASMFPVGTLEPGASADVAAIGLRDGSFELKDSDGDVVTAKRRLLCQTTIKDGRIWYERPAGE